MSTCVIDRSFAGTQGERKTYSPNGVHEEGGEKRGGGAIRWKEINAALHRRQHRNVKHQKRGWEPKS